MRNVLCPEGREGFRAAMLVAFAPAHTRCALQGSLTGTRRGYTCGFMLAEVGVGLCASNYLHTGVGAACGRAVSWSSGVRCRVSSAVPRRGPPTPILIMSLRQDSMCFPVLCWVSSAVKLFA